MRLRRVFLASLVAALGAAVPSHAALPKACNLVTDVKGDAAQTRSDIVSADIATGATEIVAIIRVQNMAKPSDLTQMTHRYHWNFQAYLGPVLFDFDRYEPWTVFAGTIFESKPSASAHINGAGVAIKKHEVRGNQIIWVLDRKNAPVLNKKKNQKFDKIHATTSFDDPTDDTAITTKTYIDKQPSCVIAK